ncbi:hypothetical protein AB0Q95_24490 [Streptomyces sp. NPDC059900]|uniref:hypothetical protein n=1 Tax=Streptomyces sp. NPDC059900 TaxID=3155816 RepID=UPI003440B02C
MRKIAALLTTGAAAVSLLGAGAVSAQAQAEAWQYIATYSSQSKCIDAGQSYVREGFNKYRCDPKPGGTGYYKLYVS